MENVLNSHDQYSLVQLVSINDTWLRQNEELQNIIDWHQNIDAILAQSSKLVSHKVRRYLYRVKKTKDGQTAQGANNSYVFRLDDVLAIGIKAEQQPTYKDLGIYFLDTYQRPSILKSSPSWVLMHHKRYPVLKESTPLGASSALSGTICPACLEHGPPSDDHQNQEQHLEPGGCLNFGSFGSTRPKSNDLLLPKITSLDYSAFTVGTLEQVSSILACSLLETIDFIGCLVDLADLSTYCSNI